MKQEEVRQEQEEMKQEAGTGEVERPEEAARDETPAESTEPAETGDGSETAAAPDVPKEDENIRYMRLAADFQNYKKRTETEKSDIYAYANEKFALDLLEVLDSFERAIVQDTKEAANASFIDGMEMILTQFRGVLSKNSVEEIAAVGAVFDPNFHHAVVMEDSAEYESGMVTEVMQKGYRLKEKVIRPAMVKVAQ
jgi:molecular chaperone GrpE